MQPTNPIPTPDSNSTTTPEWFQMDAASAPIPPTPHRKFRWSIILVVILVLAVATIGWILFFAKSEQARCLTREDFRALTDRDYYASEEFDSSSSFYTYTLEFSPDSADYTTDEEGDSSITQRIGDFYTTHTDKSIFISVNADYRANETADTATMRIDKIVSELTAAGVPDDNISTTIPTYLDAQDDTITTQITIPTATVDLRSAQSCVQ